MIFAEVLLVADGSVEGLVTLQERMVNLIKQLNMPLVEVSMVIQNMISPMLETLIKHTHEHDMELHDTIINQWPIEQPIQEEVKSSLEILTATDAKIRLKISTMMVIQCTITLMHVRKVQ